MRWKMKDGREVTHSDSAYRIDWDRKAPSKGAQTVKDFLKEYGSHYIWFEEYRLPGGLLRVDYLCPSKKIAIEFNGEQHTEFNEFFQKNRSAFARQMKNDIRKIEFLEMNGYQVIELEETDVKNLTKKFFKDKFKIVF